MDEKQTTEQRFWSHVIRRGPDECWNWNAALYPNGYGMFLIGRRGIDRRIVRAHRFSYELQYGPLMELKCLHKCDNPKCVNPAHLFSGTQAQNMRDMAEKKRTHRGVTRLNSKLSDVKVRAARLYRLNDWSYWKIAARFNVSAAAIHHAVNRKSWTHVR
jgi:DNA-directed RNA polymerase specialized sigma24 family protein